jgi:purine-binding chemotaxis protein CheW
MSSADKFDHIDWKSLWEELDWDHADRRERAAQERLRQRARQYASLPPEDTDQAASSLTVLAFTLESELYGIDVMLVRGVRSVSAITPVPGTPQFYAGVVNVRGQIITVLDLRQFFGIEVGARKEPGELIIVQANQLEIGLLAHHVRGVMSVPAVDIEPLEDIRYARGMTAERMILLDVARMFEDERLVIGGADE